MKIHFRRSPTPLREVVPYHPSDPVQELRSLQRQVSGKASQSPERAMPLLQPQPAATAVVQPLPSEPRHVQLQQGKGSKNGGRGKGSFVPWQKWKKMVQKRKGKGKRKGKTN